MNTYFRLKAGTPDDENRDYLPERIKGSDIVVNENGNNSHPYPEKLKEFHGQLLEDGSISEVPGEGISGTWYEYIPDSYDPSRPVPLVLSMHGGLMTGWGQCIYTSWSILSEREGFICVFPNGHYNRFWQIQVFGDRKEPPKGLNGMEFPQPAPTIEENTDCSFTLRLIRHIQKKYRIDEQRIFMQGMSNGCAMTMQFARRYGYLLAGAAGSAGPVCIREFIDEDRQLLNQGGPVAIWESHPENNRHGEENMRAEARRIRESRYYWLTINSCNPIPKISIDGEDNLAFFTGGKAPYAFLDIRRRDHGQTLDEAFLYWDYLFAGSRREKDGAHRQEKTPLSNEGDAFAAAFVVGNKHVWWHNAVEELTAVPVRWQKLKYHGLSGDHLVMGEYTCVPLRFLARMSGATLATSEDTLTAQMFLPDGRTLQFARGSIGCMIDRRLRSMYCEALHRDGELLISVEWFAAYIMNWTVTAYSDVIYVTDHAAELSRFMADLITDILTGQVLPENFIDEALKE